MLKRRPKALFFNTKKGLHVYVYFPSCEKKKGRIYKTEGEYKGYNFLVSNSELFLLKMLQNKVIFSRQLHLFVVNL